MRCDQAVSLLDRHLDDELPAEEQAPLEAHLRGCPACTVEALRRRELLAAIALAGRAHEPDAAFSARVLGGSRRPGARAAPGIDPWRLGLAALVVTGLALAAVWAGGRAGRAGRVAGQLVDQHVDLLAGRLPVDVVSSDAHTVKPWFEGRIPFAFDLPDLSGSGWELAGGRLAAIDGAPAAQLLFRIRKHRVSVFVTEDGERKLPSLPAGREASRGFRLAEWSANGLRYRAVSDTGAEDLRALEERFRSASRS